MTKFSNAYITTECLGGYVYNMAEFSSIYVVQHDGVLYNEFSNAYVV